MKRRASFSAVWSAIAVLTGVATTAASPVTSNQPDTSQVSRPSSSLRPGPPKPPVPWREAVNHAPIHFSTDVVPILTKAGCNQGACHGAQSGKGGFKQSLRGWDPAFDWEQIAKDSNGKRIDKSHPEKSLFFLKPTAQVS